MTFFLLRKKDTRDAWVTKDGFTDDPLASSVKTFDTVARAIEYAFSWKGNIISQLEVTNTKIDKRVDIEGVELAHSLVTATMPHGESTSADKASAQRSAKRANTSEMNGEMRSFVYACNRIAKSGARERDKLYQKYPNLLKGLRELVDLVSKDVFEFKGYRRDSYNTNFTPCEFDSIANDDNKNSWGHGKRRSQIIEGLVGVFRQISDMPYGYRSTKGTEIAMCLLEAFENDIAGVSSERRDECLQDSEFRAIFEEYVEDIKKTEPEFSFKNLYVVDTLDLSKIALFANKKIP